MTSNRWLWLLAAVPLCAQTQESARDWAALIGNRYTLRRDIVYKKVDGFEAKVDVYMPLKDPKPRTTMLYIHGGGWSTGSKEQYLLFFVPYIQMGLKVVSVQYRLAGVAPAPAAVEDARCAFRWVYQNAGKFGFDTQRIVVSGGSAGGHLALLTATMDASAGFDASCPEGEPMRAAAIINYYGAVDLVEAYERGKGSVFAWLGGKDKLDLARRPGGRARAAHLARAGDDEGARGHRGVPASAQAVARELTPAAACGAGRSAVERRALLCYARWLGSPQLLL